MAAFRVFDADNDGKVTRDEVSLLLLLPLLLLLRMLLMAVGVQVYTNIYMYLCAAMVSDIVMLSLAHHSQSTLHMFAMSAVPRHVFVVVAAIVIVVMDSYRVTTIISTSCIIYVDVMCRLDVHSTFVRSIIADSGITVTAIIISALSL